MTTSTNPKIIGQIVDTIKTHHYFPDELTQKAHYEYSQLVETLKSLKDEAQKIQHSNNDMRFINHKIGLDNFRVMASTFKGFQVTIKNQDVTISLKNPKFKSQPTKEKQDEKFVPHTHNPIIKIEYRASFLARVGHFSAIDYMQDFISKYILEDYTTKIAEIHLATDVQGYNFTSLDYYRFQTMKRTNQEHIQEDTNPSMFYAGRVCTGFSFGKGDEMLRIYNKSIEIQKNPEKRFIEPLVWEQCKDYKKHEVVWRIEVQYRREKLKTIYVDKQGLLDGFESVINAIPELWGRGLEIVTHKNMSFEHCMQMSSSFAHKEDDEQYITYMTLEGAETVKASSITKRYQRADISKLWNALKEWKSYIPKETNIYKAPKTSAFQWVSNSIKGLMSTLLRHSGELSPRAMSDAFVRTDEELFQDKGLTLVDNAYDRTIDYLANLKKHQEINGVLHPVDKILHLNIDSYVQGIVLNLYDDNRYSFERGQKLLKSFERVTT